MQRLLELDLFFMQQGKVYQTLRKLAQALESAAIDYCIIGGMALVIHGYVRATQDVDILLSSSGLEAFRRFLVGKGFVPSFPGASRSFRDTVTNVTVEILITGEFPGDGRPKSVSFPNPATVTVDREGIKVIAINKLIELKLASGMSAPDRLKDLADVLELIRELQLPANLTEELDESVQAKYNELWTAVEQAKGYS